MKSKLTSKVKKEYGAPKVSPSISKAKLSGSNYPKKLVSVNQNKGIDPEELFVRLLLLDNSKVSAKEKQKELYPSDKRKHRSTTPVSDVNNGGTSTWNNLKSKVQADNCNDNFLAKNKVRRCMTPVSDEKLPTNSKLTNHVGYKATPSMQQVSKIVMFNTVENEDVMNNVSGRATTNTEVRKSDYCIEEKQTTTEKSDEHNRIITPRTIKIQKLTKEKFASPTTKCRAAKKLRQEEIDCTQAESVRPKCITKFIENVTAGQMDIEVDNTDVEMVGVNNPLIQQLHLLPNSFAQLFTNALTADQMEIDVDTTDVEMMDVNNLFLQQLHFLPNSFAQLFTNAFTADQMDIEVGNTDVEMMDVHNPCLQQLHLLPNSFAQLFTNALTADQVEIDVDNTDVEMIDVNNPFLF